MIDFHYKEERFGQTYCYKLNRPPLICGHLYQWFTVHNILKLASHLINTLRRASQGATNYPGQLQKPDVFKDTLDTLDTLAIQYFPTLSTLAFYIQRETSQDQVFTENLTLQFVRGPTVHAPLLSTKIVTCPFEVGRIFNSWFLQKSPLSSIFYKTFTCLFWEGRIFKIGFLPNVLSRLFLQKTLHAHSMRAENCQKLIPTESRLQRRSTCSLGHIYAARISVLKAGLDFSLRLKNALGHRSFGSRG